MSVLTTLRFDPSEGYHDYQINFFAEKEDITVSEKKGYESVHEILIPHMHA